MNDRMLMVTNAPNKHPKYSVPKFECWATPFFTQHRKSASNQSGKPEQNLDTNNRKKHWIGGVLGAYERDG